MACGDIEWAIIIYIVGFDDETNSPVFKFMGRRSLGYRHPSTIFLRHTQVTEDQLLAAIQAFSSKDAIQVQEFTTVADYRGVVLSVSFFVELAGPLAASVRSRTMDERLLTNPICTIGPNAHQARQKLFDALATANTDHQSAARARADLPPSDPHREGEHVRRIS
ncbi:hypothetical protein J3R83DRAFT_3862 [Lanmaoa asiatica]|nr:hypothetical protein J3R83DRAFT_3862 [Lanmaoa asiatica]